MISNSSIRADLLETFLQVVERALARKPEERFRERREMKHALAASRV